MVPKYGQHSLAEVMPAVLESLGAAEAPSGSGVGLTVPRARAVVVLLIDGLGARLLQEYAADAPFLASRTDIGPLTAGFPSSTSISLTTLGTGLPPGQHGILGISMRADETTMLDTLQWTEHGVAGHVDLRETVVPEQMQPAETAWQRAERAGIVTTTVAPRLFDGSGLTRVALRGGTYRGTFAMGDVVAAVAAAIAGPQRALCYAYHSELDMLGHIYAPGSQPWRMQLQLADRLAMMIAESLPSDALMLVTGDHGMVAVDHRIDADTEPDLQAGSRFIGGDPRSRHIYCRPGAIDDVLVTWRERLGDQAWILSGEEAVDAGWFGPVAPQMRSRIGDVVVAMRGTAAVIRSRAEPMLSRLTGQHGSLTEAEQLVPLLLVEPG